MDMDEKSTPSRRTVLKATGGAFAAAGPAVGGAVAAPDGLVELNVGFDGPGGRDAARATASAVVREFDHLDAVTVRAPERTADALRERSDVRYVEENGTMHALAQTLPWGVDRVDAEVAHADGHTGSGADVAVLDTGIDDDHPDAEHRLGSGRAFVECGSGGALGNCTFSGNANLCNEPWSDDHDHGTHVAGTIGAIDDSDGVVGVGPDVTLHAGKVLDCAGAGTFADVAAGIEWAADQGHDVVTMSFGGESSSATVDDAIEFAANQGVTLVAGVGSNGPCSSCVAYPARHPEVLGVGATNCDDDVASFSSHGPEVFVVAPGVDVLSTVPSGYAEFSGTSMAAAHVAGAAGVLAANGSSRDDVARTIADTAEDVGEPEDEQGAGLLDVAAALGLDSSDDTFQDRPHC